ncbi:gastrula zinc finger protein XlCGF57.1-like [Vanessa atalanta]|uniref:gastrula zinc finger protein XlCGF57.1-like n=1 Tax=Vanessa atalanta TaxID=42275 RepID=UPI001FCE277F|nr:gastrula zinc finger protein XlCGF57.1-like [Vanessa atalanta]
MNILNMDAGIMVETLPILGTCNLCLSEGVVKSMLIKQNSENKRDSYTDMLFKCFSIDMTELDLDDTKRLICDGCIKQLELSLKFKDQVETSLKTLEATIKLKKASQAHECVKVELPTNKDEILQEALKNVNDDLAAVIGWSKDTFECDDSDDDRLVFQSVKQEDDTDVDDDTEYYPASLSELMIKTEPDDYRPRRTRKRTLPTGKKKVSYSVKKQADLKETEKMLEVGLFPFKMGKNQSYSCAICPEKSTVLDDIKVHIMQHNITNIHVAFKKMISSTLQKFYKSSGKFRCKICRSEITDYEALKQHINACVSVKSGRGWNNLPFKLEKDQLDCPICQKTFLNFVSLNTHMNVHYPNHICDSCGKAFASKARLRGHMRTHEIGDFPCRYCDAVFDRVTKRENHVSKEHKSGIRYACKRCNISLSSFYARQKHLAEVHNEELKRYKCKACTQSYITPGHLSSHVRRDHLNERNHKCTKCDLAFYTRNSLKMHMIKHDGERIHSCNICHKSYQRKKTLREHMRIHNNDKRFICPVCGRAFTQKCTLKGHLKVHERKPDVDERVPQPLHSI